MTGPEPRRLRTQAERDADGTAWRARREAAHDEIDARVAPEHADFVKGVYDRLNAPKPPPDKSWLQTEPAPRRRWWHPYTRPTRKD